MVDVQEAPIKKVVSFREQAAALDLSDDLFSEESPERQSKFQSEVQSELKKKLTS